MRKNTWFIYVMCIVIICGCSKNKEPSAAKVEAENSKVTLEELDKRIRKLELDNLFKNIDEIAYITISEKKFETVKSSIGTIAFLVDDIKPYGNGSKLKLIIGNPINASLMGVKFNIDYGELDEKNLPIDKSQMTKEVSLTNSLTKGTWNKEEVILGGIQPEKLGYIRIHDFNFSSMSLNN